MPPEVMVVSPTYHTSVDEFSYGVLMIHMFSGSPPAGPINEQCEVDLCFESIEMDPPVVELIHKCINKAPQLRTCANEIVGHFSALVSVYPTSIRSRLEVPRQLEANVGVFTEVTKPVSVQL